MAEPSSRITILHSVTCTFCSVQSLLAAAEIEPNQLRADLPCMTQPSIQDVKRSAACLVLIDKCNSSQLLMKKTCLGAVGARGRGGRGG